MGATNSTLANAAMRIYDKVVHEQVFEKNVLWNNILRNVAQNQGATTKYLTVHYLRNVGSAAGSESVVLPTAGNQGYLQANVTMKYNFQTISLTDVALQASKRSKEYLVNALESEYMGAKEDMQRQLSRQGYGYGTGTIARVDGIGSTPTFDLDTPMVGKNPTDYLEIGNGVMFTSSETTATSTSFSLVSTITDGDTFTVDSDAGVADNDYVILAHTNGTTPTVSNIGVEVMGLKGLIDDQANLDTFQGLARSSYTWWNSYVSDSTSQRSLTEALMYTTMLESMKKGSPKYALTHFDVFSAYGQLLTPDRRYTETMELKGGFKGVDFSGIPVVADYDHPYDEMNFIDPTTMSVEDLAPISFLNEDGSILDRSSTTPAWQATLRYYSNLACSAPNKNASLRDVVK